MDAQPDAHDAPREDHVDLLVVGGGVNGVGVARDAAGRGLKVVLCEMNDLASATSSWSTKLIHGGLRYLEHYEFRLVRESLMEREVLLNAAPHIITPLRFVLPHHRGLRPAWLLRLGLFLYDHLGGRKALPATTSVDLRSGPLGAPLKDDFVRGFEYADCRVDDARLVVLNAVDARERGAEILTATRFARAVRAADGAMWRCVLTDDRQQNRTVAARAVVNAAGPWVTTLFDGVEGASPKKRLRLVKGSHLIVRRVFDHDRAYIFQNADGRIVFAIPYHDDTTLIGTTDEPYEGDPAAATISEAEIAYLLAAASAYFAQPITRDMIVSDYAGVRPLFDDLSAKNASAVTRDYAFDVDDGGTGGAPLLSVYGGKLTTYRKLAEHALETLKPSLPSMGPAWTAGAALPGGEMGYGGWADFVAAMDERYAFLPAPTRARLLSAYGGRLEQVLGDATRIEDLGASYGAGLYEREVDYLVETEWARTAADILWRRTKLGLVFTPAETAALDAHMATRAATAPAPAA